MVLRFDPTRFLSITLLIIFSLFAFPISINSAEILQITNSQEVLLGDNNRTYKVRIACLEVDPEKESEVIRLLKLEMPRRKRVNIKPEASVNGNLVAHIFSDGSDVEISRVIADTGIASYQCNY